MNSGVGYHLPCVMSSSRYGLSNYERRGLIRYVQSYVKDIKRILHVINIYKDENLSMTNNASQEIDTRLGIEKGTWIHTNHTYMQNNINVYLRLETSEKVSVNRFELKKTVHISPSWENYWTSDQTTSHRRHSVQTYISV